MPPARALPTPTARRTRWSAFLLAAALGLAAAPVPATQFEYVLANHPDGDERPPAYGLRLDELFDATAGHDVFSFDFEDAASDMRLVYDDGGTPGDGSTGDDSVRIFGSVFGGLDTGAGYGDPLFAGVWKVDFLYTANLVSVGTGGDQIEVSPDSPLNTGSITPTFAVGGDGGAMDVPIALFDEDGSHGFSFKFNNTDDHRLAGSGLSGPQTFVGWGWLSYEDGHVAASDWLFTGTVVPEPGTAGLLALGLAGLAARRRRGDR